MIEYLYDAIRAHAGEDIVIAAKITDDNGDDITKNCELMLHYNDSAYMASGTYAGGEWSFTIPGDLTKDLVGRHSYCIKAEGTSICFKNPIYFI